MIKCYFDTKNIARAHTHNTLLQNFIKFSHFIIIKANQMEYFILWIWVNLFFFALHKLIGVGCVHDFSILKCFWGQRQKKNAMFKVFRLQIVKEYAGKVKSTFSLSWCQLNVAIFYKYCRNEIRWNIEFHFDCTVVVFNSRHPSPHYHPNKYLWFSFLFFLTMKKRKKVHIQTSISYSCENTTFKRHTVGAAGKRKCGAR